MRTTDLCVTVTAVIALFCSGALRAEEAVTRPDIPEEIAPLERIAVEAAGGEKTIALVRRPPGKGPFPAVVFFHGGLRTMTEEQLRRDALSGPTHTRFLEAGYVTVTGTHRSRAQDPQAPAVRDCVAVVEYVKKMPGVDPRSVVVMGGSGGASLALEVAGETQVAAVAAGEPAAMLFTGMFTRETPRKHPGEFSAQDTIEMVKDPKRFYTPELQRLTREKIRRISAPILIAHGDGGVNSLLKINREILLAELEAAGKKVEFRLYPGQPHGFYFGRTPDQEAARKFFVDCDSFFRRHLATQPAPVYPAKIRRVPAKPPLGPQ